MINFSSYTPGQFPPPAQQKPLHIVPQFKGNEDGDWLSLRLLEPDAAPPTHACQNYSIYGRYQADEHLFQTVQDLVPKDGNILELGCNNGNNLIPLSRDYKMYGIDVTPQALDILKTRIDGTAAEDNIKVAQWDFVENGDIPWAGREGKFHAIYATHVLSHLSDEALVNTMQAMQKYLAPGGVIISTIIDSSESEIQEDKPGEDWVSHAGEWIRKTGALLSGYIEHAEDTVKQAFDSLELLEAYSRPFNPTEKIELNWQLPKNQLRWVVYQKPYVE